MMGYRAFVAVHLILFCAVFVFAPLGRGNFVPIVNNYVSLVLFLLTPYDDYR